MLNIATTALLALSLVGAQGEGCPMMGGGMMEGAMMAGGMMRLPMILDNPEMIKALNLTEDQQKKLKDLRYSHQDKVLEIKQKLEREELALRKLMDADTPDKAQIEAKIKVIGGLRTDMEIAHVGIFFDVQKLLTADQLKQLKSLRGAGSHMGAGNQQGPGPSGQGMPGMQHE